MKKNIAIIGATGAVGQELLAILEQRQFPIQSLKLLASKRSAGKEITFKNQTITIEELSHDSFEGVDIVFSAAGGSISAEYVPSAVKAGAVVIDNTSHYRMDPSVPLIVPEVNPEAVKGHQGSLRTPIAPLLLCLFLCFHSLKLLD